MAAITFYTNPMSRGRIARWMLEETGAPYDVTYLSYGGTMKGPDYLAINPMGKVPAIVHGDQTVTECAAICAYLADAFPAAGLAPPTDKRGAYYRWLFFAAGPVESAVTNRSMGFTVPGDRKMMAGYGDFDDMYSTLIKAVSDTPYICGDQFTAADVYVGSQVGWGLQFGSLPAHDALAAYFARLENRPARLKAAALDDAAMAEQGPTPPG
ncbi:MAG: glutathione S-transferase family protein [Hyphomonas sp.]|uniref:glutathione S-transferase family protein n=1 Tax=Hyphomonas sp. TaxID=87 RepID=UPI003528D06B